MFHQLHQQRYTLYGLDHAMKRQLLEILACPVCKHHPLNLEIVRESDGNIVEGNLSCPRCGNVYPVTDGIPDLMPPGR